MYCIDVTPSLKQMISDIWNYMYRLASTNINRLKSLKGIMSPDESFLKAYKIQSVLSLHGQVVFKFLACLVLEKKQNEVSFFENTY